MSKEYLNDVLNKFAQVTSVLVETSKIKEYLDTNCRSDEDLKIVLERTKTEVENLCDHSETIKDLFFKQYKEVSTQLNCLNGEKRDGEDEPLDNCDSKVNADAVKPIIKLVDINKLVEPKTLTKSPTVPIRQKKSVDLESTVVIITSSDEEPPKSTRKRTDSSKTKVDNKVTPAPISRARRKAAKETRKKTQLALQICDSSESDSNSNERPNTQAKGVKNGNRRKAKLDEKITLSDASVMSDISDVTTESLKSTRNKKNKKETKNDMPEPEWKKDKKFNCQCYVKVMRVPCEKLKEYYLEKLELLEVKKLCNMKTLKRKRDNKSDSEQSDSGDKDKETKKSKKKITKNKEDEDKNTSDDGSADDAINADDFYDMETPDVALQNESDQAAELALGLLNSDKEDDKEVSAEEEETTNTEETAVKDSEKTEDTVPEEKDKEAQKSEDADANKEENEEAKNEDKEASDKESDEANKTKEVSDKDDDVNETKDVEDDAGAKDKSKEASDKEDNEADKNKNSSGTEEEEDEKKKEKDKAKKAWRKDKLLTQRLSSTDSEEEFEKFCKKKDKMQEEVVRLMKKRMKKPLLLDSDSDDKKAHSDEYEKPSSSSSSSSSESEKEKEKKEEEEQKKRKRVKRVKDSSDEDDEEKSTRKQIRNIWGRDSLAETTKKAEAEEKERKARIAEKQKKYNQMYEGRVDFNAKVDKVVLDFDEKENKELLRVDDELVKKLKPHQASGIQFMWDACFESLERAKSTDGSGCILAHCMGLGKTLQVIALAHTLLTNYEETGVKKVMVVCPLNTVLNWVSEYKMWLPDIDEYEIYELVSFKQIPERVYRVKTWHNCGGVLIIGYDMFRNLSNPDNKRISKKMRNTFQEALVDPGPDLVICDEGHLLKNEKTNLSIAMNRLRTLRRIVLTGTPLQNNLKEYFCMVQFIKPNLLGTYKEYLNRFVNPITNGQYTDSTPHDIQIMRKRSHVLHKMLDGIVQRRDYSVLQPYLPPKHEYVLFLNLTEIQIKLYSHYMQHYARRSIDGSNRTSFLFVDFQHLQRICTHPRVLLDKSIEMKNAKEKAGLSDEDSEGSLRDFIADDEEESGSSTSSSDDDDDDEEKEDKGDKDDGSGEEKKKKKSNANKTRVTRAAAAAAKENGEDVPLIEINDDPEGNLLGKKEWWQEYCDGDELDVIRHSNKIFLLFEILRECEQIGDKVLVFSQSLYSLNVIEYFLGRIHDATQEGNTNSVEGHNQSWCLGLDYFRLDGSSSCDNRSAWCKIFNDPSNTRARLFLISTKAGGLGINLFAANRVVIFDVSWNPSHDIQSIYRVYRFGQTKPCYIYRFVVHGTMEMKIYERQVTKQAISKRVIDEQQIDRHYNQNDLAELYKFDPCPENRPIPLVPKDVLLGELLQKFEDKIFNYHEHQSLLENKEDEVLNEEERKAAWEEFENEKKQRHNMNLATSNYLRQNTNIELAMSSIIRKENPTWTEAQVKALVPALQVQLHEEIALGDLRLYRKVQQEIQILHALHNQKLKEQFYQQQAMKLLQQQQQQQQQMTAAMRYNAGSNYMDQFVNQIPGTSRGNLATSQAAGVNSSEIIDLND